MVIKIEKGVPLTATLRNKHSFPFKEMDVTDSFKISFEDRIDGNKKRATLIGYARRFILDNKLDWEFRTSINKDKKEVRIWRTK